MPFKPEPPQEKRKDVDRSTVIRRPAKFVQGQFVESDYESDLEGARIPPRWQPPGSDAEDATNCYKKIHLPKLSTTNKLPANESKDKTPSPPSKFDANPPQFDGPPRPAFKKPSPPPPSAVPPVDALRKSSITGTETVQRVQMEESTRFSKRFVTGNNCNDLIKMCNE